MKALASDSSENILPHLVTLTDLAEALRVSPHTIRAWVRKGKLRPVRICRRLLFDPTEIADFLARSQESLSDSQRGA